MARKLVVLGMFLALAATAFAQSQSGSNCAQGNSPQCNDTQTITTSGNSIQVGSNGGLLATFSEVIAGSPVTVSIVVQGCSNVGSLCNTLDTYTTVANAFRNPTINQSYDYYKVTASWTGGTNVSVTIRTLITTAVLNGSGGSVTTQTATGVTALNFPTCFTTGRSEYDIHYNITLLSTGTLGFQFFTGGAYDTASVYQQGIFYLALGTSSGNSSAGPNTGSNLDVTGSPGGSEVAQNYSGWIRVTNLTSTTTPKPFSGELFNYGNSLSAAANQRHTGGLYNNLGTPTGFRLFSSAASGFNATVSCAAGAF